MQLKKREVNDDTKSLNPTQSNEQNKPKGTSIICRCINPFNKRKKHVLTIGFVVILAFVILNIIFSRPGKIITTAESSLKEVLQTNELSTLEYTYNSIATVSNEKENMYYVSYKGTVKAGFNFDELITDPNEDEKIIYITIPDIKINSVIVDEKSLDFIFLNDKYNTETTYQEAYRKSIEDLQYKAENNLDLKEMARENAISTISALIKPWEAQLPDGYKVEYK